VGRSHWRAHTLLRAAANESSEKAFRFLREADRLYYFGSKACMSYTPQPWSERSWFTLPLIRTAAALSSVELKAVAATVRYSTFKIALPPAEPLLWHYSRPLLSELYFLDLCLSARSWIRVEP